MENIEMKKKDLFTVHLYIFTVQKNVLFFTVKGNQISIEKKKNKD